MRSNSAGVNTVLPRMLNFLTRIVPGKSGAVLSGRLGLAGGNNSGREGIRSGSCGSGNGTCDGGRLFRSIVLLGFGSVCACPRSTMPKLSNNPKIHTVEKLHLTPEDSQINDSRFNTIYLL